MKGLVHSGCASVPGQTEAAGGYRILEVADLYEGRAFDIAYPFCRDTFTKFEEAPVSTWRPGVEWEADQYNGGAAYCDGEGGCRFTVVSVHKPGRYPTRIFYTRIFTNPDGKRFGKGGGPHQISNIVPACKPCNSSKGARCG